MKYYFIGLLMLVLVGCGSQSPMQKLKQDVRYSELNHAFWGKVVDDDKPLWEEASAFCKTHEEKPNCGPVIELSMALHGSTEIKSYGTSGNELHLPSYK